MFDFERRRLQFFKEIEEYKNRILKELSGVDKQTLKKLRELVNDSYDVKCEIKNIRKELKEVMASIAELTARLSAVNASLSGLETNTNAELAAINTKVANLNSKLDSLGDVENVDTTALEGEIGEMESKVASMESSMETNMATVNDKLNEMETKIDELTEGESGGDSGSGNGGDGGSGNGGNVGGGDSGSGDGGDSGSSTGYTVDFSNYSIPSGHENYEENNWRGYNHSIQIVGEDDYYSLSAVGNGDKEVIKNVTKVRIYVETDGSVTYIMGGNTVTLTSSDMETDNWKTIVLTGNLTITGVGAHTCLTGDTLITMADGSTKRLDTIEVGDEVLAIDPETLDYCEDIVTYSDATENKVANEYDIWRFSDGTLIKTVHRHRFYNLERQAMVYMDEWKIGEHTLDENGNGIELVSHETVCERVNHYTIFTEKQNYFANGLLSGNRYTKPMAL